MKKFHSHLGIFFSCLVLYACSEKIQPKKNKSIVIAEAGLNVRAEPSKAAKRVGLIKYETEVTLLESKGPKDTIYGYSSNWIKISAGEISGWVFAPFISTDDLKSQKALPENMLGSYYSHIDCPTEFLKLRPYGIVYIGQCEDNGYPDETEAAASKDINQRLGIYTFKKGELLIDLGSTQRKFKVTRLKDKVAYLVDDQNIKFRPVLSSSKQ